MTIHWMLWREISAKFLLVVLILITLILAQRFYQVLSELFNQVYDILLLLELLGYLIPQVFLITFPIATVGVVFAVTLRQVNDGEWIALSSSGNSIWLCIQPYMLYAGASMAVMLVFSLWIGPITYDKFYVMRIELLQRKIHRTLYPNTLSFDLKGMIVYVGDKLGEGVYEKVLITDRKLSGTSRVLYAEKGTLRLSDDQKQIEFVLENGQALQAVLGTNRLQTAHFQQLNLLQTYTSGISDFSVRGLSSRQLLNRFRDAKLSLASRVNAQIQFMSRFADPLSILSLVLMALVLAIKRSNARRGRYGSYLQLIILLVVHFLLRTVCRELLYGNHAPALIMFMPVLIIGGYALWQLHRFNTEIT